MPRGLSRQEIDAAIERCKADAREHPERWLTQADRLEIEVRDLKRRLREHLDHHAQNAESTHEESDG